MTALTDYCTVIRDWIDIEDISDAVVTSWIRDGEERMNEELRTTEQITRQYATFDDNCATLPPDWIEFLYVRLRGGRPFDYITPHDYWTLKPVPSYTMQPDPTGGEVYPWPGRKQHYTIIGSTLYVWPPIDPNANTKVEVAYFRAVAPLDQVADVVFHRYPSIYRNCTLAAGAAYLIEDERLSTWAGLATAGIEKANAKAKKARHSGSPIAPKIRSFG